MDPRRAWMAGTALVIAAGSCTSLYVALHFATKANSSDAFFAWTYLAAPLLGALAGWATRHRTHPAPGQGPRTTSRVFIGGAAGILVSDAVAFLAVNHISCDDPYASGECGFGTLVVGMMSVGLLGVLAIVGFVLAAICWFRQAEARRTET